MGSEKVKQLSKRVDDIVAESSAECVAVAFHDHESGERWSRHGDEWFHAASTIKVPVLVGVFGAVERGDFSLESRLHVRNRFLSVMGEVPYRVEPGRDANAEVHACIGKTMKIRDLARHMIVTSSNLATNLLVDLIGVEEMQKTLEGLGVEGVELRRGVEDDRAYEEGVNNRVTADGLVRVLDLVADEEAISPEASEEMLEILHQQEFRSGIPAGVPEEARVANKTGEISTVAHDCGLVYLPDRKPYALAILTRWDAERTGGRRDTLATISRAVYEHLSGAGEE